MKKFMKSLMLVAAAAMALTSCQNEEMDSVKENETYTMTFVAGAPESRTSVAINGETAKFSWSEGDILGFYKVSNGVDGKQKRKSDAATIATDGTATFTVSGLDAVDGATSYNIAAFYPDGSWVSHAESNYFNNVQVKIPSSQTLTEGSFDPAADLLMSKPFMNVALNADVKTLQFQRLAAIGRMNLKGVYDDEIISSVTVEFTDINVNGQVTLDMENSTFEFGTANTSNAISLNGELTAANAGTPVFFTCFPGNYAGDYAVTVVTDAATYYKEGTIDANKPLKFTSGNVLGFSVAFAEENRTAKEVVTPDASGEVTIDFSTTNHRVSQTSTKQVWSNGGVTLTNDKANSSSNVVDSSNPVKLYAHSAVTIDAPGNITKIVFVANTSSYATALKNSIGSEATASGSTVTWNTNGTATQYIIADLTAQVRLNSLTVTYGNTGGGETTPTLEKPENLRTEVDEDNVISITWDTVTNAESYILTVNGEETETAYNSADIEGDWNSTYEISVVAVAEGYNNSEPATTTVKIGNNPSATAPEAITIAEFLEKAVNLNVYYELTGKIKSIANSTFGNITIEDETASVYVYGFTKEKLVNTTNDKSFASLGLKEGDVVTLHAIRNEYNGGIQAGGTNGSSSNSYPAYYISHYGITATASTTSIEAEGGNATITVTSVGTLPEDVTATISEGSEFVSMNFANNTATVTFAKNEDAARSATVTFICGLATESVTLSQKAAKTGGEDAEPAWTLVTDASTLAEGDQIIIAAKNANVALSTTQNSNNRGQTNITKVDNTISEPSSSVQILTLKAGKTSGTWAFHTGSGYLYAASSSKNYLKTETSLSANSSWNITITSAGVATIKATGSNTRNWMRHNSSSSLFACYSSGQNDIVIYKLQ